MWLLENLPSARDIDGNVIGFEAYFSIVTEALKELQRTIHEAIRENFPEEAQYVKSEALKQIDKLLDVSKFLVSKRSSDA